MQAKGKRAKKNKIQDAVIVEQLDESEEKVAYTARQVETAL